MKNRTINAVVILGILSLVTILMVQLLWMKKTIDIQETSIAIQAKEDSLNIKEFGQQVHVALRNVLEEINENTINSFFSEDNKDDEPSLSVYIFRGVLFFLIRKLHIGVSYQWLI